MAKKDSKPATVKQLVAVDLNEAIAAQTEGEAEAFVAKLAQNIMDGADRAAAELSESTGRAIKHDLTPDDADQQARFQICYHAAIYHHTELARIQQLYKAKHPVYQTPKAEEEARPEPEQQGERAATTAETEATQ